jgi:hypothetical protein
MDCFRKVSLYDCPKFYLLVGRTNDRNYKLSRIPKRLNKLEFIDEAVIGEEILYLRLQNM